MCAPREATVSIGFLPTSKGIDRGDVSLCVTIKIEVRAIGPGMTGEPFETRERHALTKISTGPLENIVEHPGHGEDRRPTVKVQSCYLQLAQLAARLRLFLEHRDSKSLAGQFERSHEPAHASAHHHHLLARCEIHRIVKTLLTTLNQVSILDYSLKCQSSIT